MGIILDKSLAHEEILDRVKAMKVLLDGEIVIDLLQSRRH